MSKDWAGDYYEEKFEFPLWKLIKERAEEKDVSYLKAMEEVAPEFAKDVRIRDKAFEDEQVNQRLAHFKELEKKASES